MNDPSPSHQFTEGPTNREDDPTNAYFFTAAPPGLQVWIAWATDSPDDETGEVRGPFGVLALAFPNIARPDPELYPPCWESFQSIPPRYQLSLRDVPVWFYLATDEEEYPWYAHHEHAFLSRENAQREANRLQKKAHPDYSAGLPPIFGDCCEDGGSRLPTRARPVVSDSYVYGTNRYLCARLPIEHVPADAPCREPYEREIPNFAKAFDSASNSETATPIPEITGEPRVACKGCGGRGTRHDCLACGHVCHDCHGYGEVWNQDPVEVGSQRFASWLLLILRKHGVGELRLSTSAGGPARWRLGDAEGLIMPLVKA
jgi:hypothetical protein